MNTLIYFVIIEPGPPICGPGEGESWSGPDPRTPPGLTPLQVRYDTIGLFSFNKNNIKYWQMMIIVASMIIHTHVY